MPSLEVKIPPMGESIASGIIAKWHVRDGDLVQKEQPLFELETDKITSEGTAEAPGRISLKVAAGDEVKIGQVVATIDSEAGRPPPSALRPPPSVVSPPSSEPSPAVRRLAAETGIAPATVAGTGKAGRVTKGDMLAAAEARPAAPPPPEASNVKAPVPAASPARQTRRKMSPLRAKLAQRLVTAQHQAAMLTTFNEVDMSAVVALRAKYQDDFVKKHGLKLGFMSFFAKAVVHALREVPAVNALLEGETIVENHFYDLGIAVSTDKGLMVPVIRSCEALSLAEIEKTIADLAQRARDGKVTLADLEGGVFTITNGGIFGSMLSTPILNPPQSAILGLHAITERPVAVNGQ
ncbi:MAG: dihydrolipoyllysine-residue succinyltransferase, partial [Verrucomicrobia bacterium]|nr:dihydrolipoyllysine-residue succinyltransferase [Verrucomicrobiota bacterium]